MDCAEKNIQDEIKKMREASGNVVSDDKLVCFLYVLLRDFITPGQLEDLIDSRMNQKSTEYKFTNGWLANYAKYTANRLKNN